MWCLWEGFCATLRIQPTVLGSRDPLPLLLLFAQQYSPHRIHRTRLPACPRSDSGGRYRTIDWPEICPSPRLNQHGDLDLRLTSLYCAWQRDDAPASRVKPPSLSFVPQAGTASALENSAGALAAAHLLVVGFFSLFRQGKYLGVLSSNASDALFWIGS
jgi:hypothetical protein